MHKGNKIEELVFYFKLYFHGVLLNAVPSRVPPSRHRAAQRAARLPRETKIPSTLWDRDGEGRAQREGWPTGSEVWPWGWGRLRAARGAKHLARRPSPRQLLPPRYTRASRSPARGRCSLELQDVN